MAQNPPASVGRSVGPCRDKRQRAGSLPIYSNRTAYYPYLPLPRTSDFALSIDKTARGDAARGFFLVAGWLAGWLVAVSVYEYVIRELG